MAERNIYFIGIAIPEGLCERIEALQEDFSREKGMLEPIVPHVTLLHPNCLSGIMPDQLIPKVREVAKRYLPLNIELKSVDFFGETVGFIDVRSQKLHSLQHQLVDLLPKEVQLKHFARPYRPHITIAQIHQPRALDKETVQRKTAASLQLPLAIQIDSIAHFRRIVPRRYKPELI